MRWANLKNAITHRRYTPRSARCDDCGAPHNLDTSIPSAIWDAIAENRPGVTPGAAGIGMPEVGMLCTLCIDARMVKAGLTGEAEFYFVGKALFSKLYGVGRAQGDIEYEDRLRREAALAPWSFKEGTLRERLEWCRVQHILGAEFQERGGKPEPASAAFHRACVEWYAQMVRDYDAESARR